MRMLLIGATLAMSVFPFAVSAGTETEEQKAAKLQQAAIVGAEITACRRFLIAEFAAPAQRVGVPEDAVGLR